MSLNSLFHLLKARSEIVPPHRTARRRRRLTCNVERLEDRTVPSGDAPLSAGVFSPPTGATPIVSGFAPNLTAPNWGMAMDAAGNLYVSDYNDGLISRVTPTGGVSSFLIGHHPYGLAFDSLGNLYAADSIHDSGYNKIRKETPAGVVSTFIDQSGTLEADRPNYLAFDTAGNLYYSTDSGTIFSVTPPGAVSTFANVGGVARGLAFDSAGNLYVSIQNNHTIAEVTPGGAVSTFASIALSSPGGPEALAFDSAGNLYVATGGNGTVCKVTPTAVVSTFVSGLNDPIAVAVDNANNVYIAGSDTTIWKATPAGAVSAFVTTNSPFHLVNGNSVATDNAGNLYLGNHDGTITKLTPAGTASTFASTGLIDPLIAVDAAGNVYAANYNDTIVKATPGGSVSTFVTTGLNGPEDLAFDATGNLYVANYNDSTIAKVTPAGAVSTFVSTGLSGPDGLAFDPAGNLFVANYNNSTISKVTPGGAVSFFISSNGGPVSLASDPTGNFYYKTADVWKVTPAGVTSVYVPGAGLPAGVGMAFDPAGNLYEAFSENNTVVKIAPPVAATEGRPFTNATIFHFGDADATATAGDYTAVVTLGDGNSVTLTSTASANGQIVANPGGGFDVRLSYTYADELSNQTFSVSVSDLGGATVSASTNTFRVADAPLTDTTPATAYNTGYGSSTGQQVLAMFTDANPAATAADYTPTVNWGSPIYGRSNVSIKALSSSAAGSTWEVLGTATYRAAGTFTVSVNVADIGGQSLNSSETRFMVAPDPLSVSVANLTVSGSNGAVVSNSGTFSDSIAGASVILTASAGVVTNTGNGTWSWSETTPTGAAQTAPVTITAADSHGETAAAEFWLNVGHVFTVTTTADNGNNVSPLSGSLRQAVVNVNNDLSDTAGAPPDLIAFDIASSVMQTIYLSAPLPPISNPVVIDGATESGSQPNSLPNQGAGAGDNAVWTITLDGTNAGGDGLDLAAGNSTIQGLTIQNFQNDVHLQAAGNDVISGNYLVSIGSGVLIDGVSNNAIGGTAPAARNLLDGISIQGVGATGNLVEGNYIGTDGYQQLFGGRAGVGISGGASYNTIGGIAPGSGNVIVGEGDGIDIENANDNLVQGNYIGTNAAGTATLTDLHSSQGIWILGSSTGNTIGGTSPAARNVISGYVFDLALYNAPTDLPMDTLVEGNYIGTDSAGMSVLPSPFGQPAVYVLDNGNVIGGSTPGSGNIIGGYVDFFGTGNLFEGNRIGTNPQGNPLPTPGGYVADFAGHNVIEANTIANAAGGVLAAGNGTLIQGNSIYDNAGPGIEVSGTADAIEGNSIHDNAGPGVWALGDSVIPTPSANNVQIENNSIFGNSGLGISLGDIPVDANGNPTSDPNQVVNVIPAGLHSNAANDAADHMGANNLMNFPVLTAAFRSATSTTVSGTFSEAYLPNSTVTLDFYANAAPDPSGYGQGQTWLGATTVTTDANGNASFVAVLNTSIPTGESYVSATATDPDGNTSQFCADITALGAGGSQPSAVTVPASTNTAADNVISAVNALPPSTNNPATVTLNLAGGSYTDVTASPPPGITLVINGNGTSTTIVGQSPALTVSSGNVIVTGMTLTTATNAPTILVTGGTLTLRNDTIQESTGFTDPALSVTGGRVDLGTTASRGNNILNINGLGGFINNTTVSSVPVVGDTFEINGVPFTPSSAAVTMPVLPDIYVMNPTVSGALTLSGSSSINIPGLVQVESSSARALSESGSAKVTGGAIRLVGGYSVSGSAGFGTTPVKGAAAVSDPLASLAPPAATGPITSVNLSGNSKQTISAGTYSSIQVAGNAKLTLNPGVYIIEGGGLTVTGNGSISGSGVLIFNAGSNYPAAGGNFGGITLSGNGTFNLSAATSGPYAGIVIYQARNNTRALSLSGNASNGVSGVIYAANALLTMSGNAQLQAPLVVGTLNLSGNGALTQMAAGSDGSGDVMGIADTLLAGDLNVYISDPSGYFTADELARIQDAIDGWDALLAPCNVTMSEVSDPSLANIIVDNGATSASGAAADGVLGCYNAAGEITILQGWNWYAGADPTQIGANQYDFQTTISHELGHALGLGGSSNTSSPMYETLATGTVNRTMTATDLNISQPTDATDPLTAAGFGGDDNRSSPLPGFVSAVPVGSGQVGFIGNTGLSAFRSATSGNALFGLMVAGSDLAQSLNQDGHAAASTSVTSPIPTADQLAERACRTDWQSVLQGRIFTSPGRDRQDRSPAATGRAHDSVSLNRHRFDAVIVGVEPTRLDEAERAKSRGRVDQVMSEPAEKAPALDQAVSMRDALFAAAGLEWLVVSGSGESAQTRDEERRNCRKDGRRLPKSCRPR